MYAIVKDNNIIVGPRAWSYSFFKSILERMNVDSTELPKDVTSGPVITDNWTLLPVTFIHIPEYDNKFKQLAGPFWTIYEDEIQGFYDIVDQNINISKSILKEQIADRRWQIETGGCPFVFADGAEVTLWTGREDRSVYLDALLVLPDGGSSTFKFPGNIFKLTSKADLDIIVQTIMMHIQQAFDWESGLNDLIDNAVTVQELQAIDYSHPSGK